MGFNFWFYAQAALCGMNLSSGSYGLVLVNIIGSLAMLWQRYYSSDQDDLHDS